MRREINFDDTDDLYDGLFDDEFIEAELSGYDSTAINVKYKKKRQLKARRKVEQLMERKRIQELEGESFW